uniref:Cell cycle checkpoint protein RAD1 n=1 Tax=Romanomermis culicivorax TaxID=13658 RepID=A0A915JU12_ROMCU
MVPVPAEKECLNLFGRSTFGQSSSATVKILYAGYGTPMKLLLEESGIVTDCSIKTSEPTDMIDFEFSPANVVSKVIMRPEVIRETFSEFDSNIELVEISISLENGFTISSSDSYCSSITEIPTKSEIIDSFSCAQSQTFRYRANLLKRTIKSLQLANKISMRIDQRGFLSIQYMIEFGGRMTFIEFECAPEYEAVGQRNPVTDSQYSSDS